MSENFNAMYWVRKREEHRELSEALRRAEALAARRRKRAKDAAQIKPKPKAE